MIDQSQLLPLLGLPQISIDRVEITDADVLEIHVHSTEDGGHCRSCGRRITEPHGLGDERRLRHPPIFEHRTEIFIRPKRYCCPDCHDHPTTTQRLDWHDPRSAFTRAFEQSLLRALINSTLEDVAGQDAVTPEQLEGILDRCFPSQIAWTGLAALPVLGLDEIALTKGHGNVVVSARIEDTLSILTVLKDRKRATVEAFLRTIPKPLRRTVRVVCTDLDNGFIGAAKGSSASTSPSAPIGSMSRACIATPSRHCANKNCAGSSATCRNPSPAGSKTSIGSCASPNLT